MTLQKAFLYFKYGVYTLLAVNMYLFFRHATFHEGLDCIGWLMLLFMFEWETRKAEGTPRRRGEKPFLIGWQVVAYSLVFYAWGNYYLHAQWLDFINASLWLGVVALIAADVYAGDGDWREYWLHYAVKGVLYSGLIAVAVIWGVKGALLNFYDAFLWIVCFFAIEMNLLQHAHRLLQSMQQPPRKTS